MAAYILSVFPVRSLRGGGTLQAALLPFALACPKKMRYTLRSHKGEEKTERE